MNSLQSTKSSSTGRAVRASRPFNPITCSARRVPRPRPVGTGSRPVPARPSSTPTDIDASPEPTSDRTDLVLTQPISRFDVDSELWELLDLCSDDDLEDVYNVLFGASPFSPVVKSLVTEAEPALVELRGRTSVMHKIESRYRFLASDSSAFLRGKRPSYRESLTHIKDRLEVNCPANLSTQDLETEIFVHILHNCMEYVQGANDPDPSEAAAAAYAGDGMSGMPGKAKSNWSERLLAPFKFGLNDLAPTVMKLGSAVTVSAVGRSAAERLGTQLVMQHLRYQAAVKVATGAARTAMAGWQRQAALQAAQKGLTAATARYSAVRGAMSFLGPVMWGWLAVDLMLKAVGTDYARVIRAVFILAQIRLVRTQGFLNPVTPGLERAGA